MLRWLLRRRIAAFGRTFGYDVSYMLDMVEVDPGAALRFGRLSQLSGYRRAVPATPWHAAHVRAALSEDCGPCVQLTVTMAGVPGCRRAGRGPVRCAGLPLRRRHTAPRPCD